MKSLFSLIFGVMFFGSAAMALPQGAYAVDLKGDTGIIKDKLTKSTTGVFDTSGADNASAPRLVGELIKAILGVVGIIFLGLIIYGGFLWMTDTGDGKQVGNAKNIIQSSVIGLLIVVLAYSATIFIVDKLLVASGIQ